MKTTGKVREIYDLGDGRMLLFTTDRISAFDVIMPNTVPGKGEVLNSFSEFWFNLTREIVPNHMISTKVEDYPREFSEKVCWNGRSMLVKKLEMLPFECIVSGYLTGSNFKSYKKSGEVCGIKIPSGMEESEQFSEPIFCPSTKAPLGEHDEYVTFDTVAQKLGEKLASELREKSIAVYKTCRDYAYKKGIIIADTKFEFGLDENGVLTLADEVCTPDSSRFWDVSDYKIGVSQRSFDKQFLRDWLTENGENGKIPPPEIPEEIILKTAEKYRKAFEIITK